MSEDSDKVASALRSVACALANGNIDDVSAGLHDVAGAIHRLGNADASTHLGAIEGLGMQMEKAANIVADGLSAVADAIRESK